MLGRPPVWTVERIEQLRTLYAEGLSAKQIAVALGAGISRNAVIGKVHRLGLERRGKNGNYNGNGKVKAAGRPKKVAKPAGFRVVRSNWNSKSLRVIETFAPTYLEELRCVEISPRNLTLLELGLDDCRYIAGDNFLYCGHPRLAGKPYCPGHNSLTRRRFDTGEAA